MSHSSFIYQLLSLALSLKDHYLSGVNGFHCALKASPRKWDAVP